MKTTTTRKSIHFFITPNQHEAIHLIGRKPKRGLEPGIVARRTENALHRKGVIRYKNVIIQGKRHKRLFLTAKGQLVKGL